MSEQRETTDFPVTWDDPAHAERTWTYDPVHTPGAVSPLGFELGIGPFVEGFGWGLRPVQINYYIFYGPPEPPDEAVADRARDPDRIRRAAARWHEAVRPEVREHADYYRTVDFDALDDAGLASEVERLRELRFRAGRLHTMAITPHWLGMTALVETYKELTGGDDLSALRLVQGHPNKSAEAGERLWQVSRIAAEVPSVRDQLLGMDAASANERFAEIERDPAAAPFLEAFRAYLDEFGWRSLGELAEPTWIEDPTLALTTLRAYLETDGYDPASERRRLADEREAAIRETMAQLEPAARRRLEDALDVARRVVHLAEDHNHEIDQRLYNAPRRLLLATGRRLVARGALRKPDDVFFLRASELLDALRGQAADLADTAARRREELRHWRTVTPPPYVGAPPRDGAPATGSGARSPVDADGTLRGAGVSAGVARGVARVIGGLHEAGRLRPGDVLVTSVTQPAWTPLFTVASAVVTEVGGMLSHTAIASREYGIPAVVAVPDATRRIPDGRLIEVDGRAGVVRVVG